MVGIRRRLSNGRSRDLSAENGIGTAGSLYAIGDELPPPARKRQLMPFAAFLPSRKTLKKGHSRPNWREILSTFSELAGISAISVGCGWYSLGLGFISGGVGLVVLGVATGVTGPVFQRGEKPPGKPEK
jgi:hypothetical protein